MSLVSGPCSPCRGCRVWRIAAAVAGLLLLVITGVKVTRVAFYIYNMEAVTHRAIHTPCLETPSTTRAHPKLIHQIFFQGIKYRELPAEWRTASRSCQEKNPDYQYILWTEEKVLKLVGERYPWLMETYVGYKFTMQRIDVARFLILHTHGGIYLDLDVVCLQSFCALFHNRTNCDVIVVETTPWGVANFMVAAKAHDPFIGFVISKLNGTETISYGVNYATIMFTTGPMSLSMVMLDYGKKHNMKVISLKEKPRLFTDLHASTWHTWDGVIIRKVSSNFKLFLLFVLGILAFFLKLVCRLTKQKVANHHP